MAATLYGTNDADVAAALNAEVRHHPMTPPPQQPPPGYGEAFSSFDADLQANDGGMRLTGQGGAAPSRPAQQLPEPSLAQVMLMLSQLIQGMPASIAAAVKTDGNHRMDNIKLDVKNFARIRPSRTSKRHGRNGGTNSTM